MNDILLNDLLQFDNLENVRIRMNLQFGKNWDPIKEFQSGNIKKMLDGNYWNDGKKKSYKKGQITIGLVPLKRHSDKWLLFHVGLVTEDLKVNNGVGYKYEPLTEYEKFCGRVIVEYKNCAQNTIRTAENMMGHCRVWKILPEIYNDDFFPGYDKVNLSWMDLQRVVQNESWKTALENQKGVYLIVDKKTGRKYVGSAYGENMLLGRWMCYVKNGHGGNVELKKLGLKYIKENFFYSILEIFKSTVADERILERESWWKNVLLTREFGYNEN
ncbi:MAG: GIY-YIG nuclease family protein [Fibrobacter sp.]|nr:GIY-YIG nuclease family protein [Fibrobacter sp.]